MSAIPRRVAVVGGGVAGLAAAWELAQAEAPPELLVLEAGDSPGGKLRTEVLRNRPVDAGADAFLARVPDAVELCHELGLGGELVSPAERSALLLVGGVLRPFPDGLVLGVPTDLDTLAVSGLVSPEGVTRAARDLEQPAPPLDEDVAVGPWVRDRVGDEVFETLVAPLLSGINAGDADRLSLEAGAAQLAAAARAGGSLIRFLAAARERAPGGPEAPVFHSLAGGTGRLVETIAGHLGPTLRTATPVTHLEPRPGGGLRLEAAGEALEADAVVLATPAPMTAGLLGDRAPETTAGLAALEHASVAVVTFVYRADDVGHPLDASGFLVPEREGLLMTACSFGSSKWPQWAQPGEVVLRVSAGRAQDSRVEDLDDATLLEALRKELEPLLDIVGAPRATRVTRWPDALPQYRPGHLTRVETWEAEVASELPGVVLAGAALRGLGIPACVASGRRAARLALRPG